MRQTWGEQLISNFGFGLMFALFSLPAIGLIVLAIVIGHPAALVASVALAVIYLLLLALVQTALQAIFQAALYLYARDGRVPEGFRQETLAGAMG